MTAEKITALFTRLREAYMRHDSVALAADYAEDCVVESPLYGTLFGRAAVEKAFRYLFAAFPDLNFQFGDLLIAADQVARAQTVSGTDTGGLLGQGPTGKQFRFFVVMLYVLDDRGIIHERRVYDINGLVLQLATDSGVAAQTAEIYRATLERVRLEQDLSIAAEIQRALLP